ncbi:hypothetical protein CIHG_03505 [Coccidioides immitis H538.4]|uniref:Cytoskeleton organization protein n=3 Tax=Coccidioides immitis TaxID=5501 RepID=A0A0J8RLG9_COCIT|nr:hypothetical protein CIRG_08857 [Coccidioides immitis RMSCC 2394]KMU85975.1 hypothetical protein CIHG_03505 [Coccidioides immitis H538.4]TPX20965.1 hypothetical protein DIZ76_016862 [Coccidioides immitis]
MSSAAVIERRNKQIQDAVQGGNLKQALQLCEKRLKKGENTPFLKAWKANILFHHADDAHRERGVAETLELCKSRPAITDIDALEMLQNTLAGLEEHTEALRELWQNAAKANPQDEDIQLRWFTLASEAEDWKTAQKAAMSLQINFPKTRRYYFWAIFMCYLIAADAGSSLADKTLFGTLAYRMISKAADSVPTDPKELLSPGRAIQTAEELLLLIKIYSQQGRYNDIVDILNSQHLGVTSRIAQSDWSFVTAKLATLEKAALWEQGLSYTKELLSLPDELAEGGKLPPNYEEKDDWQVWSLLLTAVENVQMEGAFKDVEEFIENHIAKRPKSRNAQLARLDLTSRQVSKGKRLSPADLLTGCKIYFDNNKTKLYCFNDLRRYLTILDESFREEFHSHVVQHVSMEAPNGDNTAADYASKTIPTINALKFEYCFRLSVKSEADSTSQAKDFARRCLQLFRTSRQANLAEESPSTIETQPSDDFCLLAAMSLIRVHEETQDSKLCPSTVLTQAAGILEHLLLKSPHNYEGLLLLVRVYLLLGAGSLALKTFAQLSVKQIQYETVAHNVFTRISTIHPQAAPPFSSLERKDFDPQTALRQALIFYRNAVSSTAYSLSAGLDHGSYVNVEGSIDLQRSLKHSICRKLWALEVRKIQRLAGGPSVKQYDQLVCNMEPVIDKRTFDGFMNCELPGDPIFEEHVRLGPLPRERAVKAMAVTDTLLNYVYTDSSLRERLLGQVNNLAGSHLDLPDSELTPTEIDNIKIHHLTIKLISALSQKPTPSDTASIDATSSEIEAWLSDKVSSMSASNITDIQGTINLTPSDPSTSSPAPSWVYLHANISLLETLKAISLFVSSQTQAKAKSKSSGSIPKEKLESLKALTKKLADIITMNTRILKTRIAESGMLGQLVSIVTTGPSGNTDGLSAEIEEMIDTSSLELFCGSLMESWDEALDGVLLICSSV